MRDKRSAGISAAKKGKPASDSHRAANSAGQRRRFENPQARRKVSDGVRCLWSNPDYRDMQSAAQKGVPETYYSRFMRAIGNARYLRSQQMDAVEQAFYDGLVTMYGQGEVLREVPFGPYIVDFYVPKFHLAYELDGWRHERLHQESDKQRDAYLLQFAGLPVSRVKRSEVKTAMKAA